MHFTFEEERTVGEVFAAVLGISGIPMSRNWRERRRVRRDQKIYEEGLPGVDGVREAIPTGRDRTALLERDVKFLRQSLDALAISVTSLATSQTEMKGMIATVDKKLTGNGGNTYDSGDVLQRVAKALGVWEVGSDDNQNRRKDDEK